jgi:hypothetical protein
MRHDIAATELREPVCTHPSSTEAFNEVFDKEVPSRTPSTARVRRRLSLAAKLYQSIGFQPGPRTVS